MSTSSYPVQVDATLDTGLSRWLWLVKWLLVIPHYIVLFFLWIAFVVLSVVALVAIVVTGRYPRGIFEFNVGVLRWSWRVAYYAYGGLGTDHYPPFTLSEVPDYPAHLEVAYPERLSRGLALVKWWLLAIPHYLVLAVLVGGGWYAGSDNPRPPMLAGGLLGLMVLIAAVVLLFTGRYPTSVFDLVLGINRWALRVAAYVALMTDQYPPFRLDLGGAEPDGTTLAVSSAPTGTGTATVVPAAPGTPGAPSPAPGSPGAPAGARTSGSVWGVGRVLAVVVGAGLFLVAGGLLTAATTGAIASSTLRDDDGYLMSPSVSVSSSGSAVVSQTMELRGGTSGVLPERLLGHLKTQVDPRTSQAVFIGVARADDAATYLAGVAHSTLLDPTPTDGGPRYAQHHGGRPTTTPSDADIWVTSASGTGQQTVTWPAKEGEWTLVLMNTDGSPGVTANVAVGATVPAASGLLVGLFAIGGVLLLLSVVVLVLAVRRPNPDTTG
jgi:hypothetical protein